MPTPWGGLRRVHSTSGLVKGSLDWSVQGLGLKIDRKPQHTLYRLCGHRRRDWGGVPSWWGSRVGV